MIPVNQTIFKSPGGDCFRACVASIFEMPIEAVPHFLGESAGTHGVGWAQEYWEAVLAFSEEHGHEVKFLEPCNAPDAAQTVAATGLYYIAIGQSPRCNYGHCVVMHRGEYVHDPVPSGGFLAGEPWTFIFFVAKDSGHSPR